MRTEAPPPLQEPVFPEGEKCTGPTGGHRRLSGVWLGSRELCVSLKSTSVLTSVLVYNFCSSCDYLMEVCVVLLKLPLKRIDLS